MYYTVGADDSGVLYQRFTGGTLQGTFRKYRSFVPAVVLSKTDKGGLYWETDSHETWEDWGRRVNLVQSIADDRNQTVDEYLCESHSVEYETYASRYIWGAVYLARLDSRIADMQLSLVRLVVADYLETPVATERTIEFDYGELRHG